MRIISQDEYCDLPYEWTALCVSGKTIYADFASAENVVMAIYSSEEKANKAMEMCREKYISRMELDGGYDIVHGCYVQPNYWVLPKVFQFPKDEEVEDE